MRNLFLGILVGMFVSFLWASKLGNAQAQSRQSPKTPPPIYSVDGEGWQTCSDWKPSGRDFKIGYVIGHDEAILQLTQILGTNPNGSRVLESLSGPRGIKYGDEMRAVDTICDDYRNVRIALPSVLGIVMNDIAGRPPMDEKGLQNFRCLAAAGADESKIRACTSQQ
jgi:hypothetical protein